MSLLEDQISKANAERTEECNNAAIDFMMEQEEKRKESEEACKGSALLLAFKERRKQQYMRLKSSSR